MRKALALGSSLWVALAVVHAAAAGELPRLAVVDFAERGALKGSDSGSIVADLVASRLKQRFRGRFEIYERMELKKIVDELELSTSDLFDNKDKAAQVGRLAKVNYLLVGSVGKLGESYVIIVRVVNVSTGKVREAEDLVAPSLDAIPARLDELAGRLALGPPSPAWMGRLGLVAVGTETDPELHLPRLVEHRATGIRLALIPAGELVMGSARSAEDCARRYGGPAALYEREHPAHRVRIARPFYLGQHEVTNAQYRRAVPTHRSGSAHGLSLDGDGQPAVRVSYHQAAAFCERHGMRLPTEAEWEYACRAGSTALYAWGSDPADGVAHCNAHDQTSRGRAVAAWRCFSFRDGHVVSAPVGSFAPNRFRLYDMHGNVWEWCSDEFDAGFYGRPGPHVAPRCTAPKERLGRVVRGGSWREGPERLRCAYRDWSSERVSAPDRGFRVAIDVPKG